MTCTVYCVKIEKIFDDMIRLSHEVLPENRRTVNSNINEIWRLVTVFVQSIKRDEGADFFTKFQAPMGLEGKDETVELMSRFEFYVTAGEKRLLRNLEDINYRIGDFNTFQVISGEGRIETVSKAVYNAPFGTTLTNTRLDHFPDVFSCFEKNSGQGQPRSETCSFRSRPTQISLHDFFNR